MRATAVKKQLAARKSRGIPKCQTGITGLDLITMGGIPRGRTSLVAGGAGSGKTLLAMQFLVRGALEFDEPGVAMVFEETDDELIANMASLGYDLNGLVRDKKLAIDHVRVERREIEETGEYDLEALFIRLNHAIDSIKAKRVVLDTIEVLFSGLNNLAIVRSELRRLFRWLKNKGVTAIVTAETGSGSITRHGLEEYVADCVIMLDHRVTEQISTRRIRVVKYRGSLHGTNEYPFLLDDQGISVLPITSVGLTHQATTEHVSSGIAGLNDMLSKHGFYRASSVLVSGTAGTGKSSIAAHFANAACERGERALYFAFEESPSQILRNMSSVGLDLEKWMRKKLLKVYAVRPTSAGLENHLVAMHREVEEFDPAVVIIDPITNLLSVGETPSVKSMLTRLIDFLKMRGVTALFTNLSFKGSVEHTSTEISSLMDSWLLVRDVQSGIDRKRVIYVLKSRGMEHSSAVREMIISAQGIRIVPLEAAPAGIALVE